jgi:hypothetical protein
VQTPVVGKITKLSGRWSYKLHVAIPKVLQVVAGVPIVLHSLYLSTGRGIGWRRPTARPTTSGHTMRSPTSQTGTRW